MRGAAVIALFLAACVGFADCADARSKSRHHHHERPAASERAPAAETSGPTKEGAVGHLDQILNTRIKSICRGC
jgi:hypothetical protein